VNWKNIWKTEIKPRADKRYYTKKKANSTFVKSSALTTILSPYVTGTALNTALGNYYTKAQSDSNYYSKAQSDSNYYTKAQSDAKYAPVQPLYRGSIQMLGVASAANDKFSASISFGATFSAAPTVHYIKVGDAIPAGCSGTAAAPNAAPGNLCLFESGIFGAVGANRSICSGGLSSCGVADPFGAGVYVYASAAGSVEVYATWAARPVAVANPAFNSAKGDINQGAGQSGVPSLN
jgi:hypothetical protein